MPTENERKFVLRQIPDIRSCLKGLKNVYDFAEIEQGYLAKDKGMTTRIRKTYRNRKSKYHFAFKKTMKDRVIEIETAIDQRDFHDLWKSCTHKLLKTRVYMDDWEVDFFMKEDRIYFLLAEIEMPENQERPETVISFVKDHLLYEVPKSDSRFTSRKLSDVFYATLLWDQLEKSIEKIDPSKKLLTN